MTPTCFGAETGLTALLYLSILALAREIVPSYNRIKPRPLAKMIEISNILI